MSYTIVPQFTSAKSDGADATKIQPSNWNASRVINGGVTGDLLCYDSTQTSHVNGVAAVAAGQVLISAGPGVLPAWSAAPALTSATFTSFDDRRAASDERAVPLLAQRPKQRRYPRLGN